jgi:hypothetical protein
VEGGGVPVAYNNVYLFDDDDCPLNDEVDIVRDVSLHLGIRHHRERKRERKRNRGGGEERVPDGRYIPPHRKISEDKL